MYSIIGAKVGHIQASYGAHMGDHTEPTNSPYKVFVVGPQWVRIEPHLVNSSG